MLEPAGVPNQKPTKVGDVYKRYNLYYTPEGTISRGIFGGIQKIKDSFTIKEMEDELTKLK